MTATAQPLRHSGSRSSTAPALDEPDYDEPSQYADPGYTEPSQTNPGYTEPDQTEPGYDEPELQEILDSELVAPEPTRFVPSRLAVRAPRAPFVVLLLVLLGGGLLCLLLLNTALTERAFQVHELQAQAEQLAEKEQALVLKVDQLSNPDALAAQAAALGMAPGDPPMLLPAGEPLPPGARVVAREPGTGALLVVVAPPPTEAPAPAPAPAPASPPAPPDPAGVGTVQVGRP